MRKSVLLFASLFVMAAFGALSASASASPVLKNSQTGMTLMKNEKLLGYFAGQGFVTGWGNVVCNTYLEGELKENTGTHIAVEFKNIFMVDTAGTTGKECVTTMTGPDGKFMTAVVGPDGSAPWCLETPAAGKADEIWLSGGACGKTHPAAFTVELHEGSAPHNVVASCTYEAETAESKGTYTTKASPLLIPMPTWGFALKAGNPFWCPPKGNLQGQMQLTTNNGKAEPLVIE